MWICCLVQETDLSACVDNGYIQPFVRLEASGFRGEVMMKQHMRADFIWHKRRTMYEALEKAFLTGGQRSLGRQFPANLEGSTWKMRWTDSLDRLAVFGPCPISCCYRVTGQFTWQQYCEYPVLHKPYVALLPIIMPTTGNGQNSIYTLHTSLFYGPKILVKQLVPDVELNVNVRIYIYTFTGM